MTNVLMTNLKFDISEAVLVMACPFFVEKAQARIANDSQINGEPEGQAKVTLQLAQQ